MLYHFPPERRPGIQVRVGQQPSGRSGARLFRRVGNVMDSVKLGICGLLYATRADDFIPEKEIKRKKIIEIPGIEKEDLM